MNESYPHCPTCDYNLTGLVRNICPECGKPFDPMFVRADRELRRLGSPAYRKRGLRLVLSTAHTVVLMLLRPRRFALRLRFDEPLAPAVTVFVIAILHQACWVAYPRLSWLFVRGAITHLWVPIVVLAGGAVLSVLVTAILFAATSGRGNSPTWTFRRRFRFWYIVCLYSTIFTVAWPWFGAGVWALTWRDYTTDWRIFYPYYRSELLAGTLLLLWWTLTLSVMLWMRHRPRWVAIILMLAAYGFARVMVQLADGFMIRLAR